MAASTTLMTFMVRTPPTTRSVALYGSWDNFSAPYPMSRDIRLGPEHWSGCHSFENIICDGNTSGLEVSRNGGLKMGGTYWYYYKLDDQIEFHNSSQPATTRCPLLPGQIVNELHVPFALSGSRARDASVSSTSSERRTMDPETKFTNPRPVPAPPKLVRLNSSPGLPQSQLSKTNPPVAYALSREDQSRIPSTRVFHLPRKSSLGSLLKTTPSKPNPAGLRPAFSTFGETPMRSQHEKYQDIVNWIPDRQEWLDEHHLEFESDPFLDEPVVKPHRGALLLRSNSEEVITLASFRENRRQRSRSRSRGRSAHNSVGFEEPAPLELDLTHITDQAPLSALIEVSSAEYTPAHGPMTGRRIALEALEGRNEDPSKLEKRLPTLPNTPSSAYPKTAIDGTPSRRLLDPASHFSCTTIDTSGDISSIFMDEEQQHRFLAFNQDTMSSPISDSTVEDTISSPTEIEEWTAPMLKPVNSGAGLLSEIMDSHDYHQARVISSAVSCTTISSAISTTPTTSYGRGDIGQGIHQKGAYQSGDSFTFLQHYRLPEIENASEVTLKRYDAKDYTIVNDPKSQDIRHKSSLSHSEGMQQLLDELSYLSAMIQTQN